MTKSAPKLRDVLAAPHGDLPSGAIPTSLGHAGEANLLAACLHVARSLLEMEQDDQQSAFSLPVLASTRKGMRARVVDLSLTRVTT